MNTRHVGAEARGSGVSFGRTPPHRHWRRYGTDSLPTGAEALDEPFAAFPSWIMHVTCERCGRERMFNEVHSAQRDMLIRDLIAHREGAPREMRRPGREGGAALSRLVRKIVLREGE